MSDDGCQMMEVGRWKLEDGRKNETDPDSYRERLRLITKIKTLNKI
jgi:hypothetical protein